MKTFIVVLCLVAVIAAHKNGPKGGSGEKRGDRKDGPKDRPPPPPGCENPPKNMNMTECCPDFAKFTSQKQKFETCKETCRDAAKGNGWCCKTDCMMADVLTDGTFDPLKSKAALSVETSWDKSVIDPIVDECVANAPATVAKMRSIPKGHGPNCTEATTLNMVIGTCIKRELFFRCPGLSTTDECQALVKFGKSCPMFPFHGGCKGDKRGKNKSGENSKESKKPSEAERSPKKPSKDDKPAKQQEQPASKGEKSAKKDEKPPKKDEKPPKKDEKSPKKDEKSPKKDEKSPKKDEKPPKKDQKQPKKDDKPAKKDETPIG